MADLQINPNYETVLSQQGLTTPDAFLALPGVIYCGHPDRHVMKVQLGSRSGEFSAFLKKEHRVRWRDRFLNGLAGFGFVSKSLREWKILKQLYREGIGCPDLIAAGEDKKGRAFLLLRETPGQDLRIALQECSTTEKKFWLLKVLGCEIARIHQTGFAHGDLYSKHVLVRENPGKEPQFLFLDWQRAIQKNHLPWSNRLRDLVTLCATLPEDNSFKDNQRRLLQAYLKKGSTPNQTRFPSLSLALSQLQTAVRKLQSKRRIRELRAIPLPSGLQNLIWLKGEELCVTRQFYEQVNGSLPDYLQQAYLLSKSQDPAKILLPGNSTKAELSRRSEINYFRSFWNVLKRKTTTSEELRQAGTIFRLERYRVNVPRLLAVGQRPSRFGRVDSFLLTAPLEEVVPLRNWLESQSDLPLKRDNKLRQQVIQKTAELLRLIHAADCVLGEKANLVVRELDRENLEIGVDTVAGMRPRQRVTSSLICMDFQRLWQQFSLYFRRGEQLKFLLHYLQIPRLDVRARKIIRNMLNPERGSFPRRQRWRCAP